LPEYPTDFPAHLRARVEAEKLRARKALNRARNQVPGSLHGPDKAFEGDFRKYILRVFSPFAQGACELGREGKWPAHRIREEAQEFLLTFTIEAYSEEGHDKRHQLDCPVGGWGRYILDSFKRELIHSPEWRRFEKNLLAVAETQSSAVPGEKTAKQSIARDTADHSEQSIAGSNNIAVTADIVDSNNSPYAPEPKRTTPVSPESALNDEARREAVIRKVRNPQGYASLLIVEAGLYYRVAPRTIHRWIAEGKLRRAGRRGSVTIESIQNWDQKRSRKPRST
jgi:hypothetical protein